MSREALLRGFALAIPFSLIAACGGGGGDVANSSSESTAPTQIAVEQESTTPAPTTPDSLSLIHI